MDTFFSLFSFMSIAAGPSMPQSKRSKHESAQGEVMGASTAVRKRSNEIETD